MPWWPCRKVHIYCPIRVTSFWTMSLSDEHPWTDCVFNLTCSRPKSLFNIHLLYRPFVSFYSPTLPVFTPHISALSGCVGGISAAALACSRCPVRVRTHDRIKEGFELSSLYSYSSLSSSVAAPAHPLPVYCHPPPHFACFHFSFTSHSCSSCISLVLNISILWSCRPSFSPFKCLAFKEHRCHGKKMKHCT